MKKVLAFAMIVGTMMAVTGCSSISSGQPGMTPATGEAWYTKDTGIGLLIFSSNVYYCPKEGEKCTKAEWKVKE